MPDTGARLDRIETAIHSLTGATGQLVRNTDTLVQGLASDRAAFRESLRELNGFVAVAGIALERVEGQIERLTVQVDRVDRQLEQLTIKVDTLTAVVETGFTRMARALEENNRLITENNAVMRRLIEVLARGRGNGEGAPP